MSTIPSARLNQMLHLASLLEIPAQAVAEELQRRFRRPPVKRGATLRPGAGTPLWIALARAIAPHLRRRGEKTKLARVLGISPNRMFEYFNAQTAMPDAERALFLLLWLEARQQGRDRGQ